MDWTGLLRRIERKRRQLGRSRQANHDRLPVEYFTRATYASFRLEGLDVSEEEVREALDGGGGQQRPVLRSRQFQRLRNHAAILHHIENDLREGSPLTTDVVIRWYTAISAGLSTTGLDQAATARMREVVTRINSPQLRMQPALREIAAAYAKLLADPLVPGFNGILARLLLRYHLGRCGLPAVVFDPAIDGAAAPATTNGDERWVGRLIEMLERTYDELLAKRR
jgi:hypothetical protein